MEVNGNKGRSVTNSYRSAPPNTSENEGMQSTDGSGSDNGHNQKSNSSDVRHIEETTGSQSNLSLEPYVQTANKAIHHMSEVQKFIQALSDLYKTHVHDIEEVSNTQARCVELEKLCDVRKERIRVLQEMSKEKEDEYKQEIEGVKKDRAELKAAKKDFEKQKEIEKENLRERKEKADERAKAEEAEQMNKREKELEKLKKELGKQYDNLRQQLERDVEKKKDEAEKKLADLEAAKRSLSEQIKDQKAMIETQKTKLKDAQDQYDILKRATDSFKKESQKWERKVKEIETEFAVQHHTEEF